MALAQQHEDEQKYYINLMRNGIFSLKIDRNDDDKELVRLYLARLEFVTNFILFCVSDFGVCVCARMWMCCTIIFHSIILCYWANCFHPLYHCDGGLLERKYLSLSYLHQICLVFLVAVNIFFFSFTFLPSFHLFLLHFRIFFYSSHFIFIFLYLYERCAVFCIFKDSSAHFPF